ncbi:MAG: TrbG/VirB9 family P-type conjugative transfer protein [Burkholderiales bacterium]|nr:TrbG/VirB9 family P-type conjugative transfer protein [Burkholderiales bacterium]
MKRLLALVIVALMVPVAYGLDKPVSGKEDSRILHTVYKKDQIYPINAVNGIVTTIEFGLDEQVQTYASGYNTAWEFEFVGNLFFLKPKENDANTNLTVVTNKNRYHFILRLCSNSTIATYSLAFSYPQQEAGKRKEQTEKDEVESLLAQSPSEFLNKSSSNPESSEVNKTYTMNFGSASSSKKIAPIEVFDNGEFTYLYFRPNTDFPSVYRVVDEEETLLNSHVQDKWLVIHGVYEELRLRAGKGVVGLYNENYRGGQSRNSGVTVPGLRREIVGGK